MTRKFRISRKEKKAIEEAVAKAESRTSGEIVPMITRQSHDYWWVHWYWAGVFVAIVSFTLWWATSSEPWALVAHDWLKAKTDYSFWKISVHDTILIQMAAAFFGFGIAFLEPIKRMILPRKWTIQQVHHAAFSNFMSLGLTETRDRTGVLIYISHLEHQVEIIADKGINERVSEEFWKEQTTLIVKGIHKRRASDAIIKAITNIGNKLAENFPPREDDTNELSNRVVLDGIKPSAPTSEPAVPPPVAPIPDPLPSSEIEESSLPPIQPTFSSDTNSPMPPTSPASTEQAPSSDIDLGMEDTKTDFDISDLPSLEVEELKELSDENKKKDEE